MVEDHDAHVGQTRPDQFDREIGWKAIFVFMVILTVVTVSAFGTMWYFGLFMRDTMAQGDAPAPLVAESRDELLPPLPRLQTTSYDDWDAMKNAMEEELSTYAWSDRADGKVKIPVEEAMQRIAEQGLPTFPLAPEASAGDTATDAPVESN